MDGRENEMNCYDCQVTGSPTTAVAVCLSCGAGMCLACLVETSLELGGSASDAGSTRCLLCRSCASALDIDAGLPLGDILDLPDRES